MKAKNLRNSVLATSLLFLTAGGGGEGGCDCGGCSGCDTANADIPSGGRVGTTYVADPPTMVAPAEVAPEPARDAGRTAGSSDDMPAIRQFLAIRQVGGPKPSSELMDKVVRELAQAGFTICGQPTSQATAPVATTTAPQAVPLGTTWKEIKEVVLGPSESLGFHVARTPGADFNLSQDCNGWTRGSPPAQNLGDKLKICGLK